MKWSSFSAARLPWWCAKQFRRSCQYHANVDLSQKLWRNARFASDSAVKHLFTRTSTISDLYIVPANNSSLPELRNSALVRLVKAGNYGAADRLRLHLLQEGIEIKHHPIYEQAAMLGMPWTVIDANRLSYFEAWFSLIPRRHPSTAPLRPLLEANADHFPETRRFLFARPVDRLPAILRFGLICATKGYIQPMLKDTLPLLLRFASTDVGTFWLREMERAIVHYSPDFYITTHKFQRREAANRFRELSIKVCCQAGWLSHAMTVLKSNPQLRLSDRTQAHLSVALRDAGRVQDTLVVNRRLPLPNSPYHAFGFISTYSENLWSYKTPDGSQTRHDLAVKLRYTNRQLRECKAIASSSVFALLSRLHRVGCSSHTVVSLRRRALSAGPQCANPWMEGELRYLDTRKKYQEVLKIYLSHRDAEAQLPGLFPDLLSRLAAHHQLEVASATFEDCPFPRRWLAMKSIVRLVPTLPEPVETLRALYKTYREEIDGATDANQMLSAFMASFGECRAPDDAVRVLKNSGKTPYLKQMETLLGVLAHAGRAHKAMALLKAIESGSIHVMLGDGRVQRAYARQSTYGRTIKGFVRAGLLEPALKVEAMMNRHLKRVSVQDENHAEVIEALRVLEIQKGST
ncbi:hypothetical protein H0H87_010039 [Tephrocybe sp. NHM501043]|nr:hypothetical protein H0H87_010039 [Tephrocybe sp. NHM501043]